MHKIELLITEKIVYPGRSMAKTEQGQVVFFEGALPGEKVEVVIIKNRKSYLEAILMKILEPSPKRIVPVCRSFGNCGGCSFQFINYKDQIETKRSYVNELLSFLGQECSEIIESPENLYYRNKMEFSFFQNGKELALGLHKKEQFNQYVSIPPCFLIDKKILNLVDELMAMLKATAMPVYDKNAQEGFFRHLVVRSSKRTGEILFNLVVNRNDGARQLAARLGTRFAGRIDSFFMSINSKLSDIVQSQETIVVTGKDYIEEKMVVAAKEYHFSVSPFSFFQTNSLAAEKLYETVLNMGRWGKSDKVLDLYSGTGTIGLCIADKVAAVTGVELSKAAVQDAVLNASNNNVANIEFINSDVDKCFRDGNAPKYDSIVVDPPRNGLTKKALEFIFLQNPRQIIYVSCNPSTLARDLKEFSQAGGYNIKEIRMVDMFPQSFHVETVTLIERDKGA